MKIVFPELAHQNIQDALRIRQAMLEKGITLPGFAKPNLASIEALPTADLDAACLMIKSGEADALIAGIDYSSRDVILACRRHFSMAKYQESAAYSTFSGLAVMQKTDQIYLLADMAACKHPTKTQLTEIIWQTYFTAKSLLSTEPKIALLSFSTLGSGGHDDFITLAQEILPAFREQGLLIDGEMQLDAAVNPVVAAKKASNSPVAGQANVLIAPDLNSGNLLYKAFEQFGGFTVAGPILQGFEFPVSDLSRGSTPADIILTIEVLARLAESKN